MGFLEADDSKEERKMAGWKEERKERREGRRISVTNKNKLFSLNMTLCNEKMCPEDKSGKPGMAFLTLSCNPGHYTDF